MNTRSALQWIRARQGDLAKVVLALFCLAWLQAAAMPCAMADGMSAAAPVHDCPYCPQPAPQAGAGHDTCVYPHGPQVDSRLTAGLFFVVPVASVIATLDAQPVERAVVSVAHAPPDTGTPLLSTYCRLIL